MRIIALILLFFAQTAWALPDETCGDGIDNDASGGDVACPTDTFPSGCIDQDRDGYCSNSSTGPNSGIDCDDTNRNIYPNAAIGVQTGCGAGEAKTCLSTGLYGSCSSGGWKPADCVRTYYFDDTGTDGGTCTFASPCQTPNMFSDRSTGSPPANFITATAGDCFIFRQGTYVGGASVVTYSGVKWWALFHTKTGTSGAPIRMLGYPGETATVNMAATDTNPFMAYNSSYIKLGPNFRFTDNTCSAGGLQGDAGCVSFYLGSNNEFFSIQSDANTGLTGDNLGGFYAHSNTTLTAHHLTAFANIGTGGGSANNNANFMAFRNTGLSVLDSVFYYTTALGYSNFRGKHSNSDSSLIFSRNVSLNGDVYSSSPATTMQNNYMEAGRFYIGDSGGPAFFGAFTIDKNTVRKSTLLYFDFDKFYANADGSSFAADECSGLPASPTSFVLSNNVDFKATSDALESRMWEINNYLPENTLKTTIDSIFTPSSNLYYNSASAASFGYFESNTGGVTTCASGARGNAGASYTLANVKGTLSKETGSFEEDPAFVTNSYIAASTNSAGKGWNVGWGTSGGSSSASARKGQFRGSGRKGQK